MSPPTKKDLGARISSHGASPVFLQRAAIVAILSFLFFLITLIFFYIQKQFMYFILSTAFLVIYVFTMIGWVLQKRNMVSLYENGIAKRGFQATWDEIKSVKVEADSGITLTKLDGSSLVIGKTTAEINRLALIIRGNLPT